MSPLPEEVIRTVAANMIHRGGFVVISFVRKPPVVLHTDLNLADLVEAENAMRRVNYVKPLSENDIADRVDRRKRQNIEDYLMSKPAEYIHEEEEATLTEGA